MNFVGLKKPEDRAAVIEYLRAADDSPEALPVAASAETEMTKEVMVEGETEKTEMVEMIKEEMVKEEMIKDEMVKEEMIKEDIVKEKIEDVIKDKIKDIETPE